mmetsp:Transcript_102396/g.293123  ORF Transcript_102396/g.293123 Transcript_102396/m.293123 type:complete len:203 (+) Transcript_102396:366-974(+)
MQRQAAGGGVLLTVNALKVGDVGDLGEGWADVEANAGIGAEVARARKDSVSPLLTSSDLTLPRKLDFVSPIRTDGPATLGLLDLGSMELPAKLPVKLPAKLPAKLPCGILKPSSPSALALLPLNHDGFPSMLNIKSFPFLPNPSNTMFLPLPVTVGLTLLPSAVIRAHFLRLDFTVWPNRLRLPNPVSTTANSRCLSSSRKH